MIKVCDKVYDIIIVGGGFVGGILALTLSRRGMRVAVIEKRENNQINIGNNFKTIMEGRTVALSSSSIEILRKIDLWKELEDIAEPIRRIFISQKGTSSVLNFCHDQSDNKVMGAIVWNSLLLNKISNRLMSDELIDLFFSSTVLKIDIDDRGVSLNVSFKFKGCRRVVWITSPLCVGADGKNSSLHKEVVKTINVLPYHQSSIVFNVKTSKYHSGSAFEHFLPSGPLAFLPLSRNFCSVVWSVENSILNSLLSLNNEDFVKELTFNFGNFLGSLTVFGRRSIYPLSLQTVTPITSFRLALIGDSAHSIHPVAGQGLNLGLKDVRILSDLLIKEYREGGDLGSSRVLNCYQEARYLDIFLLSASTDGIVRLFSNDISFLNFLRGRALRLVDQILPLKKRMIKHATGYI